MPARKKGAVISGAKPIRPTADLSAGPQKVFNYLVASVDPTHFSDVDLPLLQQYATAAHQAQQAAKELEKTGPVIEGKASPWLQVQEKSVRALVALSARLRICPQSRFDRLVAGANARPQFVGRKPWETDPDDEDDGLLARP